MPKLYDLARMTSATTGTGTLTLGVAVSGYLSFASAGAQNGDVVFYGIKDGSNSEVGWGSYSSAGPTIARNVIRSTNSNAPISCSGAEEVYITALAGDGGDLLPGFDHPMRGFDLPLNLQLNASVAANILTVAVKGNNGSDASNSNPVLIPFRDPTAANGGPVWRAVTAALSLSTSVGAHLGASSASAPFRLWVLAFDNAGTVALALWQSVAGGASPTAIAPLNEAAPANATAMSSSATSAGTFYAAGALTGKSFRILGYIDFASGQATPGSYATAPSTVQLFGPGVRRPGDTVQRVQFSTSTATVINSTAYVSTALTAAITPTAAPNLVEFAAAGNFGGSPTGTLHQVQMARGTTNVGPAMNIHPGDSATSSTLLTWTLCPWLDAPGAAASQTYTVRGATSGGSSTFNVQGYAFGSLPSPTANMTLNEIMV